MIRYPGGGGATGNMPGPRGSNSPSAPALPPGVEVDIPPGTVTAPSGPAPGSVTAQQAARGKRPSYLKWPVSYRPPVWGTADRQEQQIPGLPLIYRIQDAGDMREAYWSDPESRAIIQAAARVYYRAYSNYNDQWAEKFWQEKILNASLNEGAPPPWQALQQIFSGEDTAKDPGGGPGSSSYGSYGGGGGYGGGSGSSSVALTDPSSARGLLMQTMRSLLGRNPDESEYKQFLEALNEAERSNPRTVEMEGDTAVQAGGIDPSMVAMEYVEGLEEFDSAEGQRVFDGFMQVLGA